MSQVNWNFIIKLNEFKIFFDKYELIELSTCCKAFRISLNPTIFDSFNFSTFVNTRSYNSCFCVDSNNFDRIPSLSFTSPYIPFTEDYTESINRFKLDTSQYPYQPNKLILKDFLDFYYLLHQIPRVFLNLSTLVINNSTILIEVLNYLLNNIKNLENLELTNSELVCTYSPHMQTDINWPNSLKKLKIFNNYVYFSAHIKESFNLTTDNRPFLPSIILKLNPSHLPKLSTIYLEDGGVGIPESGIFKFLEYNLQVKNLTLARVFGDIDNMESLNGLNDLTFLKLGYIYSSGQFSSNVNFFPVLNSVKRLNLRLSNEMHIVDQISRQYPNLTELTVESRSNNFTDICTLISNFPILKHLKVMIYPKLEFSKEFKLPSLHNLESLDFNLYAYQDINELNIDISCCLKLKLVKFTRSQASGPFKYPTHFPRFVIDWNLVYFPYKMSFYRINQ